MRNRPVRPVRPACTVLVLAIATLTAFLGFATRADAIDTGTLGIRPATESDFFHLSLYPGSATDATAVLSNHTDKPITLLTYPVDGTSTPQGRFSLAAQGDPRSGVGAWVQLHADHVTVPARAELKVGFRLAVPAGTPPGDYAGGLVIQPPEQAGKSVTVGGQTAVTLNVIQRQGVRIYLHVAGAAIRTLQTGPLSWQHTDSMLTFDLAVTNTGNTTLHPTATLDMTSRIGATTQLQFSAPELLLPGASTTLHTTLPRAPLIEAGAADAAVQSEAGTSHTGANISYVPATLLAAAALLLVLLLVATWRSIRFLRRARQALAIQNGHTQTTGRHAVLETITR